MKELFKQKPGKAYRFIIIFFAMFSALAAPACKPGKIPVQEIEAREILDLSNLEPKIDDGDLGEYSCAFAMDETENLYFADSQQHCVLKFDIKGRFLNRIGHVGMEGDGLYYPWGLFIEKDKLYILDNRGRSLKIYDTAGNFVSWMKFSDAYWAETLCVDKGNIFLNIRYFDEKNYNQHKLISVFSEKGKKKDAFGKIIRSHKFFGYSFFNTSYLTSVKNKIYGAFRFYPAVFCYDFTGREVYYHDLKNSKIEEIQRLNKEGIEGGMDMPGAIKTAEWGARAINYCSSFAVDREGRGYMSVDCYDQKSSRNTIICVDTAGIPQKKLKLTLHGKPVRRIDQLIITGKNKRCAIGNIEGSKRVYLFKF